MKCFTVNIFLTLSATGLDLDDPAGNFESFMRTRGDSAGEEVHPESASGPIQWETPNETSWNCFRKTVEGAR